METFCNLPGTHSFDLSGKVGNQQKQDDPMISLMVLCVWSVFAQLAAANCPGNGLVYPPHFSTPWRKSHPDSSIIPLNPHPSPPRHGHASLWWVWTPDRVHVHWSVCVHSTEIVIDTSANFSWRSDMCIYTGGKQDGQGLGNPSPYELQTFKDKKFYSYTTAWLAIAIIIHLTALISVIFQFHFKS